MHVFEELTGRDILKFEQLSTLPMEEVLTHMTYLIDYKLNEYNRISKL